MIKRIASRRLWIWVACSLLAAAGLHAEVIDANSDNSRSNFVHITPGPLDGRIAFLTGKMLEQMHYLHHNFDDSVSSKFLDKYVEALDPQHVHFTQGDLAEFEKYRTNLDNLTFKFRNYGDTRPACEIFNRFYERLQQRVDFAVNMLGKEDFKFDNDERIQINRKDAPYPKDLKEARQLWKERVRFEYLQEHLAKLDAKKKPDSAASKTTTSASKKPKSESEEIVETLTHRYQRISRTFRDWDNDDVIQTYLTTLARVYDPHSDYFGHQQLETFSIGMNLSLFGIGAELVSDDGYCTIRRLLPGGPAEKSGKIKEKDKIIAVAQATGPAVDVVDMSLNKAVQLIRGPKGTEVKLTVQPADGDASDRRLLTLTRDEIKLEDQEAKAKIIELPSTSGKTLRLGVIDLPSFYAPFDINNTHEHSEPKTTSGDVAKLLTKLKQENVGGVILDLRRNGGGSLEEAIKLTGLFIKQGPVVQVKDTDGSVQVDEDKDPEILYDGPLMVLTSRFSASASEIVAGALQDYGRALIVGDSSTHGKGTVQSVQRLAPFMGIPANEMTNDPGAVKFTIKKFYRASGGSTQLKGVIPDVVLPSVASASKDIGESALDSALPWDTIKSAEFEPLNRVAPYVEQLRTRSTQRIETDKEFAYLKEDIDIFKKLQADKTISLNEKVRLKEKEENETRQKSRDKERLARKDPDEKVYELTLKLADKPGLPPPVAKTNAVSLAKNEKGAGSNVSTNSASISTPAPSSPNFNSDDEFDDEKPPVVDVALVEAEHILVDYLSLLPKGGVVTAVRPNNAEKE